jgi:hypothetical protein
LWRVAVAAATIAARRNKSAWSYLGISLGDIIGDTLGDIIANYGASLRE